MGVSVRIEKNKFAEKGAYTGTFNGVLATLIKINNQAKELCPWKLGELRNSLMYQIGDTEGGFNNSSDKQAPESHKLRVPKEIKKDEVVGYQGTNSDHWYPEFGTRYQAAQPFERPGKEIVMDGGKADAVMKKYGQEAMEKEFIKRKKKFKDMKG